MSANSRRSKVTRLIGAPLTPEELLADLLGHLRRGSCEGTFAENVQQRYARAVAMVAAYDRAIQNNNIHGGTAHA